MNRYWRVVILALCLTLALSACRLGEPDSAAQGENPLTTETNESAAAPETAAPSNADPSEEPSETTDTPTVSTMPPAETVPQASGSATQPEKPTEPSETTEPTERPTEPEETTKPTEQPTEPTEPEKPTESEKPSDPGSLSCDAAGYAAYIAMSGQEQQAFFQTFNSVEEFFAWYNTAKAAYEAENPDIEIGGDGNVDLGDNDTPIH